MKLIANHTIGVSRVVGKDAAGNPNRHEQKSLAPGEEIDTRYWEISDQEANSLIASGAARRKTREVADEGEGSVAVAQNTAPRGPASGATEPPDPNAVATEDEISPEELRAMTKAELEDLAAERGIDLPSGANKTEMIAAIEAAAR